MKKISMRWAVASALVAFAATACTVTTDTESPDGSTGVGGWAGWGAAGGTGGAAGSDASSTGGTGGDAAVATDAPVEAAACVKSATPTACETCTFLQCPDEFCACKANTDCAKGADAFLSCLAAAGADPSACATALAATAGNAGAVPASDFGGCMIDPAGCTIECSPPVGDAGTSD